ncbi:MAG: hypothetical protein V3R77_03900 [Candidatus Binatia bacterium]
MSRRARDSAFVPVQFPPEVRAVLDAMEEGGEAMDDTGEAITTRFIAAMRTAAAADGFRTVLVTGIGL